MWKKMELQQNASLTVIKGKTEKGMSEAYTQ